MYVLTQNQAVIKFPYSAGELKSDNPQTSFPQILDDESLAEWGVYPVIRTEAQYDPASQDVTLDGCELIDGIWYYKWLVNDLSQEQITANYRKLIPTAITMRQARLILLQNSLLDNIGPAIAAITDLTMRRSAEIEWEFSNEVQRDNLLIAQLSAALGLSETDLDNLFIAGSKL